MWFEGVIFYLHDVTPKSMVGGGGCNEQDGKKCPGGEIKRCCHLCLVVRLY